MCLCLNCLMHACILSAQHSSFVYVRMSVWLGAMGKGYITFYRYSTVHKVLDALHSVHNTHIHNQIVRFRIENEHFNVYERDGEQLQVHQCTCAKQYCRFGVFERYSFSSVRHSPFPLSHSHTRHIHHMNGNNTQSFNRKYKVSILNGSIFA